MKAINYLRLIVHFLAETIDHFRIAPRICLAGYAYMVYSMFKWFLILPEITTQHTSFAAAIFGFSAAVFGLYTNSGNKWSQTPFRVWSNSVIEIKKVAPQDDDKDDEGMIFDCKLDEISDKPHNHEDYFNKSI